MRPAALLPLAALALLAGCGGAISDLPSFGVVADFTLTDQTGATFQSRTLDGNVWVADFFFTTCVGPCPRMGSQMRQVQAATRRYPDVRLVSFTVDPATDTPAVLAAYAKRFQADPGRWFFLTGPREALHKICLDSFKLGAVDGSREHSTRFALVDRKGRIRGTYQTLEDGIIDRLVRDIETLRKETL